MGMIMWMYQRKGYIFVEFTDLTIQVRYSQKYFEYVLPGCIAMGMWHLTRIFRVENLIDSETEKLPIPVLTLHNFLSQVKRTILFYFLLEMIHDLILGTEKF